jgi:hypothetical protein
LIWSACGYKNVSGGCIRKPEAVWSKREGAGWPYLTVILTAVTGFRGIPSSVAGSLGALGFGKEGGNEEGSEGFL